MIVFLFGQLLPTFWRICRPPFWVKFSERTSQYLRDLMIYLISIGTKQDFSLLCFPFSSLRYSWQEQKYPSRSWLYFVIWLNRSINRKGDCAVAPGVHREAHRSPDISTDSKVTSKDTHFRLTRQLTHSLAVICSIDILASSWSICSWLRASAARNDESEHLFHRSSANFVKFPYRLLTKQTMTTSAITSGESIAFNNHQTMSKYGHQAHRHDTESGQQSERAGRSTRRRRAEAGLVHLSLSLSLTPARGERRMRMRREWRRRRERTRDRGGLVIVPRKIVLLVRSLLDRMCCRYFTFYVAQAALGALALSMAVRMIDVDADDVFLTSCLLFWVWHFVCFSNCR